jgi:hypothetical protein
MKPEVVSSAMIGLGICGDGPCGYHAAKVGSKYTGSGETGSISVFPPSIVWGKEQLQEISTSIIALKHNPKYESAPVLGKIGLVLNAVNEYWSSHANDLDGSLHHAWDSWQKSATSESKYGAGSWASSSQQLSQLVETVKVLRENGLDVSHVLRLGTASGIHTQQEIFALAHAGVNHPKLTIIDGCNPPLAESQHVAKNSIESVTVGSVLSLPEQWNGKWNVVTAHFIESFLPTQEQYAAQALDHGASIQLKTQFFREVYNALAPGGVFITAIGSSKAARRFTHDGEITFALFSAGFSKESLCIVPTTDPADYENGTHLQGNYFVVAFKKGGGL